jgi:hypothetical protein
VLAVVTGSRKVQHQHGAYFTVTYEFRLMSGAPRQGSFQAQKNPPAAGTRVLVIYDRERPEHNRRYPLALATAAPGP